MSDLSMMTVGTVVDTNDPQQMGRLRVNCPKWGDTPDTLITDIPWAAYVTPFGGILTRGGRGPENVGTSGPVAYGMWAIPKVGATVVCMLLDGDANHRVWIGSLHADHMPHTLPMGRFLDDGTTGPVSSTEQPIEPLSTNITTAFGNAAGNYERLTRGAENQAASISNTIIDKVTSAIADDRTDKDNRTGYQRSRMRGDLSFNETSGNFDPQTYSITTPGMHSFIMDDSLKNGKIRIRSTSGNQIILDDTNERIYISSSDGNNYIEMDKNGNVDIHSTRRVSIHSDQDINLTATESIRMSAKNIHMRAEEDIRLDADQNIGIHSVDDIVMEADASFNLTGNSILVTSAGTLEMSATDEVWLQSWESNINIKAIGGGSFGGISGLINPLASIYILGEYLNAGQVGIDATLVQTNNGLAILKLETPPINSDKADDVSTASQYAYTTNRTPQHEPWGRIMVALSETVGDAAQSNVSDVLSGSATLDLSYTDSLVGTRDYTSDPAYTRNDNWRR